MNEIKNNKDFMSDFLTLNRNTSDYSLFQTLEQLIDNTKVKSKKDISLKRQQELLQEKLEKIRVQDE